MKQIQLHLCVVEHGRPFSDRTTDTRQTWLLTDWDVIVLSDVTFHVCVSGRGRCQSSATDCCHIRWWCWVDCVNRVASFVIAVSVQNTSSTFILCCSQHTDTCRVTIRSDQYQKFNLTHVWDQLWWVQCWFYWPIVPRLSHHSEHQHLMSRTSQSQASQLGLRQLEVFLSSWKARVPFHRSNRLRLWSTSLQLTQTGYY